MYIKKLQQTNFFYGGSSSSESFLFFTVKWSVATSFANSDPPDSVTIVLDSNPFKFLQMLIHFNKMFKHITICWQ